MVAADGKLKGVPIHLHMTFPAKFPHAPPDVEIITRSVELPLVIGKRICVDMLNFSGYHGLVETTPWRGWSSAYTVSAILTQLYGLLLVDEKVTYGDDYQTKSYRRADAGVLGKCTEEMLACKCGFHALPQTSSDDIGTNHAATPRQPRHAQLSDFMTSSASKASSTPSFSSFPSSALSTSSPASSVTEEGVASDGGPSFEGLELLDDPLVRLMLSKMRPEDIHR